MVRLSTQYDTTLKDTVYMVRGDEAYAKSTISLLDVNIGYDNAEASVDGYRVGVTYNVLNDVGASTVVLYDGEEVLGVFDWTDESTATTIGNATTGGFLLAYNVPHDLWLKYKGNSKCLGSKSKHYECTFDVPDEFKGEIDLSSTPTHIVVGSSLTVTAKVTVNGSITNACYNRPILIYIDDEYKQTITTGSSSNVATSTAISGLTKGNHTIRADIVTTSDMFGTYVFQDVDVGVDVNIVDYPVPFVNGLDNTVKVQVTGTDDPTSLSVSLMGKTATPDSDGIATFTFDNVTTGSYHATCNGVDSPNVTFNSTTVTDIVFEEFTYGYNMNYCSPNSPTAYAIRVVADNGEILSNIPVKVKHDNGEWTTPEGSPSGVTSNDGIVYDSFSGEYGEHTITAKVSDDMVKTHTITSVYQYWDNGNNGVEIDKERRAGGVISYKSSYGGYQGTPSKLNNVMQWNCLLAKPQYGTYTSYDMELSFRIIETGNAYLFVDDSLSSFPTVKFQQSISRGDVVTISSEGTLITCTVTSTSGTSVSDTFVCTDPYALYFGIKSVSASGMPVMIFDRLLYKKKES